MKNFNRILSIFIGGIPLVYGIVLTRGINTTVLYIPYIIIIGFILVIKRDVVLNKITSKVSIVFLIAYCLIPILGSIYNNNPNINLMYIGLYGIFIVALLLISSVSSKELYISTLRKMIIFNGIIVSYQIITNINEINTTNIMGLFTGARQNRAYFGFSHPNTAAMFIIVELLLLYIEFKYSHKKKYQIVFRTIFATILILAICATASRTAVYSGIIFIFVEAISYMEKVSFKIAGKFGIAMFIFGGLLISMIVIYNFNFMDIVGSSSGRDVSAISNINLLIKSNRMLFGFAAVPITQLKYSINGMMITDVWYITHILQYGLISLMLVLANVTSIIFTNIKKRKRYVISILVSLIFYSTCENVMFVPGTILSSILWIIIYFELSSTKIEKRKEVKNNEVSTCDYFYI